MRSMLFWAMLLLLADTVSRLLCWSLVIFIPLSVMQAWRVGSEMRWTITLVTLVSALFLGTYWAKLRAADRARVSWLVVVILINLSVVLGGTEDGRGYSIFYQPTNRLVTLAMAVTLVMTLLIMWRLADRRALYARLALGVVTVYGLLPFLPGLWSNVTVQQLFTPLAAFSALPWFVQPAGFAVGILLPLALMAGLWDSVKSIRHGDPPVLSERWFEYCCIVLCALSGAVMLFRVHSSG